MKQKSFKQQLWLMLLMLLVPLGAWADRDVNQPQFGKQVIEVANDEVITFYDPWGTEDIDDQNSYNAQSLTVFKPAEVGMSVQITFEKIDLYQYSQSYFLYINLYDGIADADNSFTWATSSSDVTSSSSLSGLTGTLLAEKVNNDNKPTLPAVYTSGTADGALSVGFMHRNSNECEGWVAKVKVVKLENMTITGAGSNYDGIVANPTTKQNVPLANAYVTATGVMNPDNVTGIYFTMTQNEGVVEPTALKLYKGDTQVSATVEADGNNYKFVLNEAPSDGTTTFTIKGDILGTAAVGAKVQVDITKVTTAGKPDGITPFTAGTSIAVENPAIVIMTATPQTVTVGETPLQFYDEGGKDGGIVSKTNGQVTFLAGVSGKKVMVNFTKNEIWHGSYYNQELRIYNGTEVSEANLLKTLQQGETGIVRSTAEDGSLTVVLFSDANNDIAANGFEATVSLFTPQAMDFDGITTAAASTETVAAGDEADMLTITVKAKDTEPAMQVTKMAFTAGETAALVSKAALYFGTTKVGETTVEGSSFEMTLTTPQTLVEGDNLFTLKYTISEEALNDQKVSAQLTSVTALVNNAEKTETATTEAVERTVKNEVVSHADQGTVTKTVNGSISFYTKAKSSYSDYYESGTDDRINIFIPKHEGMICQIDFESFKLYYYSYNVSSSAKFKIYSGQGTSGEVLWEPTTQADYNNGPDHVIRSTAADGSLTVYFNANQSYSTSDGWKATVSEYQSKPMAVAAVEVAQASTADASIGAANQDLLTVNVKTEGNENPLTLNSMKLNLKGTEANISKVTLWQGDTQLGEANAAAEVTISIEPLTLKEGDNEFTVKADVSGTATEEQTIDAKLISVNAGSADVTPANGDPDGARTLKNQVLMTAGEHGTMNLGLGQKVMLYDDGGPEGDGANGVEATITLVPTGEAESIRLTDKGFTFNYTSHLYIYEGTEVNDEKMLKDITGSSAKLTDPLVVDGPVTLKYVGAGSYTKPNFALEAEGYKKKAVEVVSVTTEDISVSEVLKGQTEVKMLKITVETEGDEDKGTLDLTAFNVTATGEALDAQHIYQTNNSENFSPTQEFNEKYTLTKSGTYYFWLCLDMKADATVGQTATASLTSIVAGGETVNVTEPATATVTIASGKSGDYTVGQGGDYATIQGAVDDLGTLGMEGPVTLKIKAGEYNEKVRIPYIKGMGAQNTLTLESESGQRDVKIYHNQYTSGGYSDDQDAKVYGVITLYEAQYVTLKDLDISTTDANYDAVVMVKNESRHITIDNCYLHAPFTATNQQDINLVHHYARDVDNCNNDYLTVKNSLLEGGWMGVNMGGTGNVSLPKEVGGVIESNTFKNQRSKAIQALDELGLKVRNNNIIIDGSVEFTNSSVGILDLQIRDEHDEALEITGNTFNVNASYYCPVINIRQLEATENAPAIIANNVMNQASLNASYSGIKFGGKVKNVNVAYNTIRLTGENGGAAFWASAKLEEGYGNINVVNNIIQNETNGYAVNIYHDDNLGITKINFQNNVMSCAEGATFFRAASSTNGDFAAFVDKTGATNCINKEVTFLSDDVLEPADDLDGDLLKAVALSYVTTDITGKERPTENITIGAYEYDPNAMSAPVMAEGYPKVLTHLDGKASFSVKTDLAATIYYIVKKSSETAPTADELAASETKITATANTESIINVEGLEDDTEYIAYFLPVSLRNIAAETVSQTEAFTMDVTPEVPEVEVYINNSETEETVASGTEVSLFAMVSVSERTAPYTLTWMDSKHNVLQTETFESADDIDELFTATATPTECTDYIFTVTDNAGQTATATVRAIVTGEAVTATFENLYLDEESYENGKNLPLGSFVSGSYKFDNFYSPDFGGYWGNYGYANITTTDFTSYLVDQFKNVAGGGANGSQTYMVAYPSTWYGSNKIHVMNNAEGDIISGFYITNDAWTADNIVKGDGYNEAFGQGDYLKLTITADNGKTLDYYLADYRAENEADRYYVKAWEWVDLRELGTVKNLSFTFDGTKKNDYGLTTAAYFCMDDFNGTRPETEYDGTLTVTDGQLSQSLNDIFGLDAANGTITYELPDGADEDINAEVSIDDEGNLIITGTDEEEFTIVVKATQAGHTVYMRLPVSITITDGINAIGTIGEDGEYYDLNGRHVETPQKGIYIFNGKKVLVK